MEQPCNVFVSLADLVGRSRMLYAQFFVVVHHRLKYNRSTMRLRRPLSQKTTPPKPAAAASDNPPTHAAGKPLHPSHRSTELPSCHIVGRKPPAAAGRASRLPPPIAPNRCAP